MWSMCNFKLHIVNAQLNDWKNSNFNDVKQLIPINNKAFILLKLSFTKL